MSKLTDIKTRDSIGGIGYRSTNSIYELFSWWNGHYSYGTIFFMTRDGSIEDIVDIRYKGKIVIFGAKSGRTIDVPANKRGFLQYVTIHIPIEIDDTITKFPCLIQYEEFKVGQKLHRSALAIQNILSSYKLITMGDKIEWTVTEAIYGRGILYTRQIGIDKEGQNVSRTFKYAVNPETKELLDYKIIYLTDGLFELVPIVMKQTPDKSKTIKGKDAEYERKRKRIT